MRNASLWRGVLGVEKRVVGDLEFDPGEQVLIAHVRPKQQAARRCGLCCRRGPGYDRGEGRRRWRALDLGTVQVWLEADAPRIRCAKHGVVVAGVPCALASRLVVLRFAGVKSNGPRAQDRPPLLR